MINSLRGDYNGGSLLMYVVHYYDAFDHLLNISQDFSVVDEDGQNIVHSIAYYSFVDVDDVCSRRLMKLSQKTNVESFINRKDSRGQTPLHYAANRNLHRTIETIIKLGGDVNLKNDRNKLPDEQDDCDDETKRIIRSSRKW